jgi:hypothetical protein
MKQKQNIWLAALTKPDKYPLQYFWINFIIISPVVGLAVNGFSGVLFDVVCGNLAGFFGLNKLGWQISISFFCIAIVIALISNVVQHLQRLKNKLLSVPELETQVQPLRETFRGLIAIASTRNPRFETPAEAAICYHWPKGKLKRCWLICSQEAMKTVNLSIQALKNKEIPLKVWIWKGSEYELYLDESAEKRLELYLIKTEVKEMEDGPEADQAHDPNYIREQVDWIYHDATYEWDLVETDVVADYTGGTKSMTAGMMLACLDPNRKIQYIWSELNEDKTPKRSEFWEVKVSYKIKSVRSS